MLGLNNIKRILGYSTLDLILSGKSVRESVLADIEEKSVHLNGSQWSKSGNCVILVGGSGSGKGWVKDNLISADFQQVFDVDNLKLMYNKLVKSGSIKDDHGEYSFSNSDDVSALHKRIKDLNWDKSKDKLMLPNKNNIIS